MMPFWWRDKRDKGGYYLLDWFETPEPAGRVSPEPAPGPGAGSRQVVVDTESKMSIVGGRLTFSGGKAAPAFGDPSIWYRGLNRVVGLMLFSEFSPTVTGQIAVIGFDHNQATIINSQSFVFNSAAEIGTYENAVTGPVLMGYSPCAGIGYPSYRLLIALRSAGAFYFILGGPRNHLSLMRQNVVGSSDPVYPGINNYSQIGSFNAMIVPAFFWLPSPLASDGFGGTIADTDGLGHQEGVAGGLGAGGSGVPWTQSIGTYRIAGARLRGDSLAGGIAVMTGEMNTPGQLVISRVWYTLANKHAGLVARYADTQNYLYAYVYNTGAADMATLRKVVGGVDSAVIADTAITYVAGSRLEIYCYLDKVSLYYNGLRVGSEQTMTDVALFSATKAGFYTNDATADTLWEDFSCYATGSEGQYDWLSERFLNQPSNFYDGFNRSDSAALNLSEDGRLWSLAGSNPPQIVSNRMVIPAINGAGYGYVDFHKTPHDMACNFSFSAGGGGPDSARMMFVTSNDLYNRTRNGLHLFWGSQTWVLQVIVNSVFNTILNSSFVPALTTGTIHRMVMTVENNTITLQLPYGALSSVTDSRISGLTGKHCVYEIMNSDIAADMEARFENVEAYFSSGGGMSPFDLPDSLTYLFRDLFTTSLAAGSVNGSAAEPGVGTRTVTDAGTRLSISSGRVMSTIGPSSWGEPRLGYSAAMVTRAVGLMVAVTIRKGDHTNLMVFSLGTSAADYNPNNAGGDRFYWRETGRLQARPAGSGSLNYPIVSYLPGYDMEVAFVLRSAGCFMLARGQHTPNWQLVGVLNAGNTAALWPILSNYNSVIEMDSLAITQLQNEWATGDYGIATQRVAAPVSGETILANSDAVLEFTWTPGAGETLTIMFRRQDDNNCMKLVAGQAGGTFNLYKRIASVDTSLSPNTQTWTVGVPYRIVISYHGSSRLITNIEGVGKHNYYATVPEWSAKTGAKATGFATGSDFISYPKWVQPVPYSYNVPTVNFMPIGDSKTMGTGDDYTVIGGFPSRLASLCSSKAVLECPSRLCFGGYTVSDWATNIGTYLPYIGDVPEYVLINLGANEASGIGAGDEAVWKANYTTIHAALLAKWPMVKIYMMRVWRRGFAAACNLLATWIADLVAANPSYLFLGPDERVFLEGGDNGVTYTTDGTHPNAAGYNLTAAQWKTVMGL